MSIVNGSSMEISLCYVFLFWTEFVRRHVVAAVVVDVLVKAYGSCYARALLLFLLSS